MLAKGPPPLSFGQLVRQHRSRARLTQHEVARRSGVSIRTLRDLEMDRVGRPHMRSVSGLISALQLADADQRELWSALGPPRSIAARLRIGVLGPMTVHRGESTVAVTQPMLRNLLGLLALRGNQVVSQDEIVDTLWGERPPKSSRTQVSVFVCRLRASLEPHRQSPTTRVIEHTQTGYLLRVDPEQIDLRRFDSLVGQAREAHDAGDLILARQLLARSLSYWRGGILADCRSALRQQPDAVAAQQRRIDAVITAADIDIATGHFQKAATLVKGIAVDDPLHEGLHARLMLSLAGSGQQAAALKVFAAIRNRLDRELGILPGRVLSDAHLNVLRQLPTAAARRDNVSASAPAPDTRRTATRDSPAWVVPRELPHAPSTLVGRESGLALIRKALDTGAMPPRLVALNGPGGTGKSVLAITASHAAMDNFPDGQLYVDLQGSSPGLAPLKPVKVLGRFLRSLGAPEQQISPDPAEAAARFRSYTARRRVLVLLDNAADTAQLRSLLPAGSGCAALITSRGPVNILDGVKQIRLSTLEPDKAVELLRQLIGAERVERDPDAAHELVHLCGLLPLAIRIVGTRLARSQNINLPEMVSRLQLSRSRLDELRLDDLDVRSSLDIGYRRLILAGESGRSATRLFRRLGILLSATFTRMDAAALIDVDNFAVQRQLDLLADHGLIEETGKAYQIHDLLRLFATELAHRGETPAEACDRHPGCHPVHLRQRDSSTSGSAEKLINKDSPHELDHGTLGTDLPS